MGAQAKSTIIPPPGMVPGKGKESSYCKAYRAGLKQWCDDKKKNKRKGDFNSYVFKKLKTIDPKLYDAVAKTREIPIGVITGGVPRALGALGKGGRAAANAMKASVATGGLGVSAMAPFFFRIVACGVVRRKLAGTAVSRVLCPDAYHPDGTPIEIKRPSEPESHNDQRNNYAKCSPNKKCIALDAQSCIGKKDYKEDCPPPKYP